MQVSTTEYEFAHGKKPRGAGHWAFYFGKSEVVWWADHPLTYGEAKQQAIAAAKAHGASYVRVAS